MLAIPMFEAIVLISLSGRAEGTRVPGFAIGFM
jgi:hypothetical protein